jgi:hypothetical protein
MGSVVRDSTIPEIMQNG